MDYTYIFALLVAFQIKHFLADYPLQNEYMVTGKFKAKGWVKPLFHHAYMHGMFTGFISYTFLLANGVSLNESFWYAILLMLFDLVTHFTIDRIKASPFILPQYKPDNSMFWFYLGLDQMFHHLTHYLVIFILLILI